MAAWRCGWLRCGCSGLLQGPAVGKRHLNARARKPKEDINAHVQKVRLNKRVGGVTAVISLVTELKLT